MTNNKKSCFVPALVFLFALAVRLFYLLEFQSNPYFDYIPADWDQAWYDRAARDFAAGDYLLLHSPPTQFSYFYKFFLGAVYWLAGGNFFLIWSAQFLIGSLSVLLVYGIASRLFDRKAALLSSLLFAVYGPEIFYEGVLYREFMVTMFSLLSCYALLLYAERRDKASLAFAGLSFACLILCRPNMILLGPFIYVFLVSAGKTNAPATEARKPALFFSCAVALSLLPLVLHMVYLQKHFVFLDSSGPRTLLLGNLPEYPGKEWLPQYYRSYAERTGGEPGSYVEVVRYLISRVADDPAGFAGLYARKVFYFFNNYEVPSSMNYYLMRDFSRVLSLPLSNFSIYGVLGAVGMVLLAGQWERFRILYLFFAGIVISVCLFYITARFRLPIVPFLMMFSSYAVFHLAGQVRKLPLWRTVAAVVCLAALGHSMTDTADLRSAPVRPIDYANLGSVYENNSRFHDSEKTRDLYVKAWDLSARLGYSENQIAYYAAPYFSRQGRTHYLRGEYSDAIRDYRRSAAVRYENGQTHGGLSLAYKRAGLPAEAIYHAEESLLTGPDRPDVRLSLVQLYLQRGDNLKARFHGRQAAALIEDVGRKKILMDTLRPLEELGRFLSQGPSLEIDRARTLAQNAQWELAEELLKKNFAAHSDSPDVYLLRGDIFAGKEESAKALDAYRQALVLGYESFDLLARMGELARGLGMDQAAAMYYRKALKHSPDSIAIKLALAELDGTRATTPFGQLAGPA
ncbi:MAG: glycosyltransferase family 39 protein [Nitrospinae bacterium]|nr:glycosyltransferase family 39 protein [Nitrospinota bacterium]